MSKVRPVVVVKQVSNGSTKKELERQFQVPWSTLEAELKEYFLRSVYSEERLNCVMKQMEKNEKENSREC